MSDEPDLPIDVEALLMSGDYVSCGRRTPRREDPSLTRQRTAGEEDQSVPGWDQGA